MKAFYNRRCTWDMPKHCVDDACKASGECEHNKMIDRTLAAQRNVGDLHKRVIIISESLSTGELIEPAKPAPFVPPKTKSGLD